MTENDLRHLQRMREHELALILPLLPAGCRILEIGAGIGWQAKALAEKGFIVTAIDIPGTSSRVWPVQEYDGEHIPFPERSFDVVFSSNVLEHISHVIQFQNELVRVLKPNGRAIHILPSGSWRFWTSLAYYPHLVARLAQRLFGNTVSESSIGGAATPASRQRMLKAILPPRHGEVGNFMSEIYSFSRWRWQRLFQRSGWQVEGYQHSRMFYTGYTLLGMKLGVRVRGWLSCFMGSTCHVFCLKPVEKASDRI